MLLVAPQVESSENPFTVDDQASQSGDNLDSFMIQNLRGKEIEEAEDMINHDLCRNAIIAA